MADFRVTIDGAEFRVTAPDLDTAIASVRGYREQTEQPTINPFARLAQTGPPFVGPLGVPAQLGHMIAQNPQEAADLAAQGIGTAAGVVAGTPAGPAGQAILGGLGNTAGRVVARALTGREPPTLTEGAVDAVVGAAGPAVSTLAGPASRLAARAFTGTSGRAGAQALAQQNIDLALSREGLSPIAQEAAQATARRGALRTRNINLGAAIVGLGTGNIAGAVTLLAGGHLARLGQRESAERLLMNPRFVGWLRTQPASSNRAQVLSALTAVATEAGARELLGVNRAEARRIALDVGALLEPVGPSERAGRQPRSELGRFVAESDPLHGEPLQLPEDD